VSDDTTTTPAAPTTGAATERTFTQADVDRIISDRLAREREKYADYEQVKAKAQAADASKSDLQKLADRLDAAEKRAAEAEATALRSEVAAAKGLTAAQAKRLTGKTKAELEADADDLLEAFGGAKKKDNDAGADKGNGDGKNGDGGAAKKDAEPEKKDEEPSIFGRPREQLTPGAAPTKEPEPDADQLAEQVWKKARGLS
jgi:hypothetical protein